MEIISQANLKFNFINNKQFQNDCCLKYRPDFIFDCGSYFVIVECDEDAHRQYDKECEIIRMNNISIGIGLPTKFIRYNPDKKGVPKQIKEDTLIDCVKRELEKDYLDDLQPIYLFY